MWTSVAVGAVTSVGVSVGRVTSVAVGVGTRVGMVPLCASVGSKQGACADPYTRTRNMDTIKVMANLLRVLSSDSGVLDGISLMGTPPLFGRVM